MVLYWKGTGLPDTRNPACKKNKCMNSDLIIPGLQLYKPTCRSFCTCTVAHLLAHFLERLELTWTFGSRNIWLGTSSGVPVVQSHFFTEQCDSFCHCHEFLFMISPSNWNCSSDGCWTTASPSFDRSCTNLCKTGPPSNIALGLRPSCVSESHLVSHQWYKLF